MDISPLIPKGKQVITGYGDGQFRINGIVHAHSILVLPGKTVKWDAVPNQAITLESLQPIVNVMSELDIVLVGCGKNQFVMPPKIKNTFLDEDLGFEVMDTGAACRTYNILVGEGRRVAAALVAV